MMAFGGIQTHVHIDLAPDFFEKVMFRSNTFRPSSPPLLSALNDDADETLVQSPLKKLQQTNFEEHICSLLQRNVSQPVMR